MSDETNVNCAIIIPIYKEEMSADEEMSLRRCLSVLSGYTVIFAAPQKLNGECYMRVCSEYKSSVRRENFKDPFFSGYSGYSALLTGSDFYKRFLKYEYILIYQLDSFIFGDDLAYWCKRGYDYVGGPFFDVSRGAEAPKRTEFLNGGFSLRKTDVFKRLAKTKLRGYSRFFGAMSIYDALMKNPKLYNLPLIVFLFAVTKFLYRFFKLELSEDFVWSLAIRKHGKIVPFNEALRFSFDSCPEYAFKLNGGSLPFGCHGWTAYYNRLFWDGFLTKSFAALKKPDANR